MYATAALLVFWCAKTISSDFLAVARPSFCVFFKAFSLSSISGMPRFRYSALLLALISSSSCHGEIENLPVPNKQIPSRCLLRV
jgi:hypothetical protein